VARPSLARLNVNGSLDPGFSVPDTWLIVIGDAIAAKPDGKILLAGILTAPFPTPSRRGLYQLFVDGGIDPSFQAVMPSGLVRDIALHAHGRIVIGGTIPRVNQVDTFHVARLLPTGAVDLSFGIGASGGEAWDVLIQPDGRIVAGGGGIPRGLSRYLAAIPDPVDTDLAIVKSASAGAMVNGGLVTYTLAVTNLSDVHAAGVTVSDTLPPGLTYSTCSATLGGECDGLGNQRSVTFGAIAPHASATITLRANVTAAAGATVENTATVSSYSPDPVPANNSSSAISYRTPPVLADLRLTKSGPAQPVAPGATLTYTLSVRNDGPNTATSVVVTDTLPAGVTFTSCTASGGTCGGAGNARTITYASLASGVTRTITIATRVNAGTTASIVNTATVSSSTQDPVSANNTSTVTTTTTVDTDGDGLPTEWETRFGLRGDATTGNDGARGDPDGDGRTNEQELAEGSHPRGFVRRFLAEGATNAFFDVRIALLNVGTEPARILRRYLEPGGRAVPQYELLPPGRRRTLTTADLGGRLSPDFSTLVESDQPVIVDRTMSWGAGGYGSHAETGVPSPATTWYLAEGSTSGDFALFYLIQNPNPAGTEATVRYLLPSGQPPIVMTVAIPALSRTTIPVDAQGGVLASTDVSAVISAPLPIIVERAMYKSTPGQVFAAGHDSAGVTALSTRWFLAEGATGPFFDCFILLANPGAETANVTIDYLLSDGRTLTKSYVVPAASRVTIWVDDEQIPAASGLKPLDNVAVSSTVVSSVPIVVERTMWWPAPAVTSNFWVEAHNSPGATETGTRWALAEGEVGGPQSAETFILIANTSTTAGNARVTLYFEDGTNVQRTVALRPRSRVNVAVSADFPAADGRRFGAVIESIGASPAQIVVERAMYTSPGGATWTAGTNALATRLQ
jgi:uncharacterized repeat protein (TIGR01451 family)